MKFNKLSEDFTKIPTKIHVEFPQLPTKIENIDYKNIKMGFCDRNLAYLTMEAASISYHTGMCVSIGLNSLVKV